MGVYTAETSKRFQAGFGGLGQAGIIAGGIAANEAIIQARREDSQYTAEVYEEEELLQESPAGLPMFDTIEVTAPINYKFPLEPMIDFSHEKNIAETQIQGGEDVVELVSVRPVAMTIRGILWDNTGKRPKRQLNELLKVFKQNEVLEVNSKSLNAHGVTNMYIMKIDTPAIEGFMDTIPYVITARSSKPVELEILSE